MCADGVRTACHLLLPQVYLQQGQSPGAGAAGEEAGLNSERWTEIAKLLSRKHDRIDPLHALSLLPDGVRPAYHALFSLVNACGLAYMLLSRLD